MARLGLVFWVALGSAMGCSTQDGSRPDILLVVIDTLRADHCSVYGYRRPTTPQLAAIASRGVAFDAAYSPMGTTGPAHATLFTSLLPLSHGITRNGLSLDESHSTLAERLQRGGYQTAAFVSSFPVSARFGFAQGFDHFDDDFEPERVRFKWWSGVDVPGGFDRRATLTTDAAIDWIRESADDAPLFIFVHFFDPHAPLDPPAKFVQDFDSGQKGERPSTIDLYDAAIAHSDDELGRVLNFVRSRRAGRELLVIATADHGEGLWDHGERGHNRTTYEEEVRVPLVMEWSPHVLPGSRVGAPVQLADLAPTILAAAGIGGPESAEGIDLLGLIDSRDTADRTMFFQRPDYRGAHLLMFDAERKRDRGLGVGLRQGRWKYFEARDQELRRLFDLVADPGESRNLAAALPAIADEMRSKVDRFVAARGGRRSRPDPVASDVLEGLRALGYADREVK